VTDNSELHFDDSTELTADLIKSRAIKSIALLTGRTFILQIITLIATFVLTIYLTPAQYGVFFLVSAVINFFAYFSDIGLAAALIQKQKITHLDLKTTFTIQQILVLLLITLIFIATPFIRSWYRLDDSSVYLLWVLAISLFFSSLKSIPSIILERKLAFNKLVIPQIAEALLFNGIAVFFAWRGYGVTSLSAAVFVRSLVGLIIIYILQPWKPGFAFSKSSFHELLQFGLPYQLNTFLAMVKDDGMTAVLGIVLGPTNMGLLGWAQKWAQAPLRFFMDQVIRVTFPAYSRMQHDKEALSAAVNRSLFFISFLVFPTLFGLIILSPILTEVIPKYTKWQPALLALALIGINTAWAAVSTPLTNLFNAAGKIKITFRLMIMWTTLTWILVLPLALSNGINGAALGFALTGSSSFVTILIARRFIRLDLIESVLKPLLAAFVMAFVIFMMHFLLPSTFWAVILLLILGAIVYIGVMRLLIGPKLQTDIKNVIQLIRKKEMK
jgi:O-antigen/teichoic acid export membrane protein